MRPLPTLATLLCLMHTLPAADGFSTEWTDVAPADASIMGDYEGEWSGAPKGHYFEINKPVAAQIMNISPGHYRVKFFQQHDCRADAYFDGTGTLNQDGALAIQRDGWNITAANGVLSGTANRDGKPAQFNLKRVVRASPTLGAPPPANATVLFDGKNFDAWQHGDGRPVTWQLTPGGAMEVLSRRGGQDKVGGDIQTKDSFTNYRIHLEFRYPVEPGRAGQARGNSGFFQQNCYELQILNSYGLDGLWNECGALYKVSPPKVNAARPPGEWQTYDVEYTAPVWNGTTKVSPAVVTARLNGVLVHKAEEIPYGTGHSIAQRANEAKGPGPIRLQDHGNPIQFRNIWIEKR